jgi:hypothetical protein
MAMPVPALPGRLATLSWEAALNLARAHSGTTATYCLEILFVRTGIAALVSRFMILTKDAPIIVIRSPAPETLALRRAAITLRSPESKRRSCVEGKAEVNEMVVKNSGLFSSWAVCLNLRDEICA